MYLIKRNGRILYTRPRIESASELLKAAAKESLSANDEALTFTMEDYSGEVLDMVTNRRITGTFVKKVSRGSGENDGFFFANSLFDATDNILALDHDVFLNIRDRDLSSEQIGRANIHWEGPCEVIIEEAIKAYFGVESINKVSAKLLSAARNRVCPPRTATKRVALEVKIDIKIDPGASWESFVEELDYSFISRSSGIVVTGTEISEASVVDDE